MDGLDVATKKTEIKSLDDGTYSSLSVSVSKTNSKSPAVMSKEAL